MGVSRGSGVADQRRALPVAALLGFPSKRNDVDFGIDSPSATASASCVDFFGHTNVGVADVLAGITAGGRFVKIAMAATLPDAPRDQAPVNCLYLRRGRFRKRICRVAEEDRRFVGTCGPPSSRALLTICAVHAVNMETDAHAAHTPVLAPCKCDVTLYVLGEFAIASKVDNPRAARAAWEALEPT